MIVGTKKEEGSFRAGLRQGEWRSWHPNGELLSISHYADGVRQGRSESYYRDGTPREAGNFVDGRRQGVWTEWLPGEKGRRELHYERGTESSRRGLPAAAAAETPP